MLVLTREVNQKITIGDDIEVIVTKIGDGKVRLGIVAPSEKKILRDELKQKQAKTAEVDGE